MDKNSFREEIIGMAKQHLQNAKTRDTLPKEQMAQLETDVYAHIDHLFSDIEQAPTANPVVMTPIDSSPNTQPRTLTYFLKLTLEKYLTPTYVVATLAMFSIGTIGYILHESKSLTPHLEIPGSVIAENIGIHIKLPEQGSRALAATPPSERRTAFLTGVAQADLDLIGDLEATEAHEVALWYDHAISNTQATEPSHGLQTIQTNIAHFSSDKESLYWFNHGYAVEVVHLTAIQSMLTFNTDALIDALQFYRLQTMKPVGLSANADTPETNDKNSTLPSQYIQNHRNVLIAEPALVPTPEQVQEIIDMTRDMKVLLR